MSGISNEPSDDLGIPFDTGDSKSMSSNTTQQQPSDGSECAIQTLYEGPPKCGCCKNWVEQYPQDLCEAVEEQPVIKQKAFIKRMRKGHDEGRPLILDSIVVQSSSLKETLGEVFHGYEGITPSLQKVVFRSPFRPFYHRWGAFTEIVERQKRDNDEAAAYSVLLYDELKKELGDVMSEIKDHLHHGVITHNLLWALFEPGVLIVAPEGEGEQERFYVVESCQYSEVGGYFSICVNFVDWDGKRFGYAKSMVNIPRYDGTQSWTSLSAYPARLHPAQDEARAKAIKRGREFQGLCGFQYKEYSGSVWTRVGGRDFERNIDGRVIVDALSYFNANPHERPSLSDLRSDSIAPKIDVNEYLHHGHDRGAGAGTAQMYQPRIPERERERIKDAEPCK
ncbi:unnamed protein product [Penicillium salamii]|nr:unnamed protein product [Penicillium salamii]